MASNDPNQLVPIKPICDALGIDAKAQRNRIDRDEILSSRGCPKSRIAPFAIVYFGKKYYLTVAKTKHYSNG